MTNPQPFELVGRLFGRERIRSLSLFLNAGGYSYPPEAFAGVFVLGCLCLSIVLSSTLIGYIPLKAAMYKFSLAILSPLVLATP